jgi:hypothetical protein
MRGDHKFYSREGLSITSLAFYVEDSASELHKRKAKSSKLHIYLISSNLISKTRVLFAGIPGRDLLPYAKLAGIVSRRSPPTDIPTTPISQPWITSPAPSLNENGLPFLFATIAS